MIDIITVLIGLAGCGAIATIAYSLIAGRFKDKSKIMDAAHKITQQIGVKKVEEITESQNEVKVKVSVKEKVSKESISKIKDIQEKAVADIGAILHEENISDIHGEIVSDWEDL